MHIEILLVQYITAKKLNEQTYYYDLEVKFSEI